MTYSNTEEYGSFILHDCYNANLWIDGVASLEFSSLEACKKGLVKLDIFQKSMETDRLRIVISLLMSSVDLEKDYFV